MRAYAETIEHYMHSAYLDAHATKQNAFVGCEWWAVQKLTERFEVASWNSYRIGYLVVDKYFVKI